MIPMPEAGDPVILTAISESEEGPAIPETKAKVMITEDFTFINPDPEEEIGDDGAWQVALDVEGEGAGEITNYVAWDAEAKVWRDL